MDKIEDMIRTVRGVMRVRPGDSVWVSNREECVESRSVVVTLLWEYGMTDEQVAKMFGFTRQGVNKLRHGCSDKMVRKVRVKEAYVEGRKVMRRDDI